MPCRESQYVALKVYVRTPPGRVNREKALYEHLADLTTTHPGSQCIRQALDMFDLVRSDESAHACLVHPPLQTTLFDFQRLRGKPQVLPEELAKIVVRSLLQALDFLHTEVDVTHCGTVYAAFCMYQTTNH
jgi:serine/threonine-protein kinase SRPK3